MPRRNTKSSRSPANTRAGAGGRGRITASSSSPVIRGPQLELATSRNAITARNGHARVVSIRIPPGVLAELDAEVDRRNEGRQWRLVGRSHLIIEAVRAWLKGKRD